MIFMWKVIGCVVMLNTLGALLYEKKSVPKLIRSDGYTVETHHVTTEDGYIIELHRIPFGRNDSISTKMRRPVAYLSHCIFGSSSTFVVLGPESALAYFLSNNGYDVWMLNSRGTTYSKSHVNLSSTSREFWQFSWHEMAVNDVAVSIDYVLKVTGESELDYIGFSMGTTQFFVLLCEKPEFNSKIRKMIGLAPVAFFNSSTGPFPIKPPFSTLLTKYGAETGKLEFPPPGMEINGLFVNLCKPQHLFLFSKLCYQVMWGLGAANNGNINPKTLPFFLLYFPDSTSVRSVIHYSQLRLSGRFAKYDYGLKLNEKNYGSSEPPSYNLSKILVPINLLWARDDTVADWRDIARLESSLPNLEFSYEVPFPSFSHMDFVWGSNAKKLAYKIVLERLSTK